MIPVEKVIGNLHCSFLEAFFFLTYCLFFKCILRGKACETGEILQIFSFILIVLEVWDSVVRGTMYGIVGCP